MKKYINRYTVSGMVVYAIILVACFMGDMVRQGIAIVLGTTVLGGICYLCMKATKKVSIPCACCGNPTIFAGYCPCGGRVDPKPMKATVCPEPTCKRPGGVVSEKLVDDQGGNQVTHRHYACSGGHSWDAFSSQS